MVSSVGYVKALAGNRRPPRATLPADHGAAGAVAGWGGRTPKRHLNPKTSRLPWVNSSESLVAPDRGGITVFPSSTSHQPPRQVNGVVMPQDPTTAEPEPDHELKPKTAEQ